MKRTLLLVVIALVVLKGAYGIAWADENPISAPPHTNFRQGYNGSCLSNSGAACHTINSNKFLPFSFNNNSTGCDFTNFCLSCHNPAGEAHQRNPGSPSTNVYINKTGINVTGMKGNSHAWSRPIGNAGTTPPTLLNLIGHTPNNMVLCETCHNGMDKGLTGNGSDTTVREENYLWVPTQVEAGSNYTRYAMVGYTTTKTYLKQYVRVYRGGQGQTAPQYERQKRPYMVNYTTYTYNNFSALVIFHAPQPSGAYIYVDIPEPYLRQSNNMNAICFDCHANRVDQSVTHAPGNGLDNSHPVNILLQKTFGLHSTLMPTSKGNVFMERTYPYKYNNTVVCTSCHQQHNAPSADGELHREANGTLLCSDCHKTKMYGYSSVGSVNYHDGYEHTNGPNVCLDCHTTHNSRNIMLINNVVNGQPINFQNFTGANSFGNDTGKSLCEVCHSTTKHHRASGFPDSTTLGHHTGANCTQCHNHKNGFQPPGTGISGVLYCDACHPYPGGNLVVTNFNGTGRNLDWTPGSSDGHSIRMDGVIAHMAASGYNPKTDTHDAMCADSLRCGRCHPPNPNHQNGTVLVRPQGFANCSSVNFTINVITSGSVVNCSNVKCHSANKFTPYWY